MFVVSVESKKTGKLHPIAHGAIVARLEGAGAGALALAKMLSAGIGRSPTTMVRTVDGEQDARAIVVSSLRDGVLARFVDGKRVAQGEVAKTYILQDAATPLHKRGGQEVLINSKWVANTCY